MTNFYLGAVIVLVSFHEPAAISVKECESEKEKRKHTRMELVTLAWPFAGDCRDKSGDSFCNREYKMNRFLLP